MARVYTKESCRLYDSEYCAMLNMRSCDTCTVDCADEEKAASVRADLDTICSNLPEEGVQGLYAGKECLLCKGEAREKKWYALTDIAHPEPRRKRATILGIAKEPRAGTVLPIQIACCERCRRQYLMLEYVSAVTGTLFAVIALTLLSIRPLRESVAAVAPVLPFFVFVAVCALGVLLGALLKRGLAKKYAADMHTDVMELPILKSMADKDWFELNPNKGMSRLVFSRSPIRQGLFSAMPDQGDAAPGEMSGKAE